MDTEILRGHLPRELGQEYGGGFAPLDDTLPVRLREVGLGHRGHPLEGARELQELHAVYGVRRAQLAHHVPEGVGRLSVRRRNGAASHGVRWA